MKKRKSLKNRKNSNNISDKNGYINEKIDTETYLTLKTPTEVDPAVDKVLNLMYIDQHMKPRSGIVNVTSASVINTIWKEIKKDNVTKEFITQQLLLEDYLKYKIKNGYEKLKLLGKNYRVQLLINELQNGIAEIAKKIINSGIIDESVKNLPLIFKIRKDGINTMMETILNKKEIRKWTSQL